MNTNSLLITSNLQERSLLPLTRFIAIVGMVMLFAIAGRGDTEPNNSCAQQELISELHGISAPTSHIESGTTNNSDIADYYNFTPGIAGTLHLHFTTTGGSIRLFVSTSNCGSGEIGNGQTDYEYNFLVNSTQTVYIKVQRNQTRSYNLAMTFTPDAVVPSLSIANANTTEGDSGNKNLTFTITQSAVLATDTTVQFSTSDGTATSGSDYTAQTNQTVTIPAGSTTATQNVLINSDTLYEADETFTVTLSNPGGATLGTATATGTIINDDTPSVEFSNLSVTEGDTNNTISFTLTLSNPSQNVITVDYTTADSTAYNGSDFIATSGTATIPAGEINTTIYIDVIGDTVEESSEVFTILLTNPTNATLLNTTATITINDDDDDDDDDTLDFTCANPAPYTKAYSKSMAGELAIIGNTNLCKNESGSCGDPGSASNDRIDMMHINVDGDNSTLNHSSAELSLPSGSEVVWAGLYWQGMFAGPTTQQKKDSRKVKFKTPGGSYQTVTAAANDFNWVYLEESPVRWMYQGHAEVTSLVQAAGNGYYSVADLQSATGKPAGGSYGAWSLVVVYRNVSSPIKNISVYNGFQGVMPGGNGATCAERRRDPKKACDYASNHGCSIALEDTGVANPISVTLSGFKTPQSGDVNSIFAIFSGKGDRGINGDQMSITNKSGVATFLSNAQNPSTNVQNATISYLGNQVTTLEPQATLAGGTPWPNTLGADIDTYDVSAIVQNNQTSTTITLNTSGDGYFPGVFAFSTELYKPSLCYDYAYKQNGVYLKAENSGFDLPTINDYIDSSPIEVSIYIRSREADFLIQGMSLYTNMDALEQSKIAYIPNSAYTTHPNTSQYEHINSESSGACLYDGALSGSRACRNGGNIRIGLGAGATGYTMDTAGYLGANEYMYARFFVDPLTVSGDVNLSLELMLDYYVVFEEGADPAPYSYKLGSDIPMCPASTIYNPVYGEFNVIDRNLNTAGTTYNNLLTQVTKRPFDVDLVFFEQDASGNYTQMPSREFNTTVQVEIIDADAFHDLNASCAHPDSNISQPIFVNSKNSPSNNKVKIPTQQPEYYNFAVKNAAYRIWYFHDGNRTIIPDWTATSENNISGLYDSTKHTLCSGQCSDSTSATCFNCMKRFYASPICSRDNFAIRPESFHVGVFDQNASNDFLVRTNSATDVNISLAADYPYALDINSTSHTDSNATPGYSKLFSQGGTNEYVKLEWLEPTAVDCNDESNTTFDVYFANGAANNVVLSKPNVGKYTFKIFDSTWTRVDQGTPLHHSIANNFLVTSDCNMSNSIVSDTTPTQPIQERKVGCHISTTHSVDATPTLTYKDLNITFKPYSLSLDNLILSHGPDANTDFSNGGNEVFIYMSDLDDESNMSINAMGMISARGKNGTILSNYVGGCYAEDINITLLLDNPPQCNPQLFGYRFINLDINDNIVTDMNLTGNQTVALQDSNFTKERNGTMSIRLHYNFDRNITTPINPERLTLAGLSVGCADANNCVISADQDNNYEYNRTAPLDHNVTFVYGRVHAPRYRIEGDEGNATLYYEVFWDGNATCNLQSILPNPMLSVDSVNWYQNTQHNASEDGNIIALQPRNLIYFDQNTVENQGATSRGTFKIKKNSAKFPYKTTIDINASSWLIYSPFDLAATMNRFDIEFIGGSGTGATDTGAKSRDTASGKTNRRVQW